MVMPNNLQRFMYEAFILVKDTVHHSNEISCFSGSILTKDYLIWCYNKHGKYDRFKNNVEKILRYNRLTSFKILNEYILHVMFGKLNDTMLSEMILDIDTSYCDSCQNKFIVINLSSFHVHITCIHSLEEAIS